jgi:hypothetical protein
MAPPGAAALARLPPAVAGIRETAVPLAGAPFAGTVLPAATTADRLTEDGKFELGPVSWKQMQQGLPSVKLSKKSEAEQFLDWQSGLGDAVEMVGYELETLGPKSIK